MSKASKRYARALYDFVAEKGEIEPVRADLARIDQLVAESPDLRRFTRNPVLPAEERKATLSALFGERAHPSTVRFLRFLVEKSRLADLPTICRYFEQFYCEASGLLKVTVTSAAPLSGDQVDGIRQQLERRFEKTVEPTTEIDPKLLGGFKVRVGDTILDYSIQAQLQRVREELINA